MSINITRKQAIRELWYRGDLSWKLHPVQQKMLNSYITANKEITVIAASRRLGKSFWLCILAIEQCLKKPNAIVKYVCPRKDQVKKILDPIMKAILVDCPPELRPEFKYNDKIYLFPNGSQIQMAGTDNGHHETLRGGVSDLWIVDEAGFCDHLKYVVNSVLAPTSDTTGGRGIIASTPAPEYDHDFNTEFLLPAESRGDLIRYTIYDNPMLSQTKIAEIIGRFKKKENDPEFRREYLCEIVPDSDRMVVPEFTKKLQDQIIRDDYLKPPFYDAYLAMDIGVRDLTVVLFAFYDFRLGKLVVEDEFIINGQEFRTDILASAIKKKEKELYTHPVTQEFKPPHLRIADNNNLVLLNDLSFNFNIDFVPTRKDNLHAALNTMRVMLDEGRVIIHPRCKTLIHHLKNAVWNKNKTDFMRSPDAGHYDAVMALCYLIRNINEHKNPYPAGYGLSKTDRFYNPKADKNTSHEAWARIFKPKKSL